MTAPERLTLAALSPTHRRLAVVAAIVLSTVAILVISLASRARNADGEGIPLFTVTRGPLVISATETGVIQTRDKHIIRNKVEGRSVIVSLVEEGKHVKEGDLLIELDASRFNDPRVEQEIRLQNSEASLINARETLAVVSNQVQADLEKADLDLRFARLDCEKYVKGEAPQQARQLEADITIAREELQRAEDKATWSRKLADGGYITRSEMDADALALKRTQLNLELAQGKLEVQKTYTESQQLAKLQSGIKQAEMAMERAQRKARADTVQAEATLLARQREYETSKAKMEKLLDQIADCRITAPADGMVVYANTGDYRHRGEPLAVGVEVSERQELIHLPAAETLSAEIKIPEATLPKLREGMPARIRVDALPDRVFQGHLAKIGPMPDTVRAWLNPDLKVYNCDVYIDSVANELRPGMSCRVELVVEEYENALFVPVQCVVQVTNQPTAYVMADHGPQPRAVEKGLDNGRMVRIVRGLELGERVLLAPPLPPSTVADKLMRPDDSMSPPPSSAPTNGATEKASPSSSAAAQPRAPSS